MTVVTPSDELMTGFGSIGATIAEEWKASAGTDGAAMLEAYSK